MSAKTKSQDKNKVNEIDKNISKIFDIKKRLGKGAYGIVWKVLDKRTNETFAVKKIFDAFRDETDAQRTFREIIFLKGFSNHPNVVKLHNIYKASNNLDIYLIFEYMESDLHNIIKKGTILKDIHKRYVMYQLFNAIKYIHSGNVIHRDLKPSNVLIDSKCRCKLADFGLARSVSNFRNRENIDSDTNLSIEPLLTDYVATRWYRAPEILVASKRYTKGIDMWSLGCILGEMIRGKPLFQGSSTVNQIEKIIAALPEITEDDIKAIGSSFGSVLLNKDISKEKTITLNELLCDSSREGLELVKSLLVLDPLKRLTAKQALNHLYVEKFRNSIPEIELNADVLPPFRDDVRLTVPEYRSKLYEIAQINNEKDLYTGDAIKFRAHKLTGNIDKCTNMKKSLKNKSFSMEEKDIIDRGIIKIDKIQYNTEKNANNNIQKLINKTFDKCNSSISSTNLKQTNSKQSLKHNIIEKTNIKYIEQLNVTVSKDKHSYKNLHRSKSHSQHHHENNIEINEDKQAMKNNSKKSESTTQLLRGTISVNKLTKNQNILHARNGSSEDQQKRNTVIANAKTNETSCISGHIKNSKSEIISQNANGILQQNENSITKTPDRICYERRLKKLEAEIERYKSEVKTFCRETITNCISNKYSLNNNQKYSADLTNNNIKLISKNVIHLRKNTPIQNTYFQLLTKGNLSNKANDHKLDFELSGNNGNGIGNDYFHGCSIYNANENLQEKQQHNNKHTKYYLQPENNYIHIQQNHHQSQRSRSISKLT